MSKDVNISSEDEDQHEDDEIQIMECESTLKEQDESKSRMDMEDMDTEEVSENQKGQHESGVKSRENKDKSGNQESGQKSKRSNSPGRSSSSDSSPDRSSSVNTSGNAGLMIFDESEVQELITIDSDDNNEDVLDKVASQEPRLTDSSTRTKPNSQAVPADEVLKRKSRGNKPSLPHDEVPSTSDPGKAIDVIDIDDDDVTVVKEIPQPQMPFLFNIIRKGPPEIPNLSSKSKTSGSPQVPLPTSRFKRILPKPTKIVVVTQDQFDKEKAQILNPAGTPLLPNSVSKNPIVKNLVAKTQRNRKDNIPNNANKLGMIPIVSLNDCSSILPNMKRNTRIPLDTLLVAENITKLIMPSPDWSVNTYPMPDFSKLFTISETVLNSRYIEIIRKSITIKSDWSMHYTVFSCDLKPQKPVSTIDGIQRVLNYFDKLPICPGIITDYIQSGRMSDSILHKVKKHIDDRFRSIECPLIIIPNGLNLNSIQKGSATTKSDKDNYSTSRCLKCANVLTCSTFLSSLQFR